MNSLAQIIIGSSVKNEPKQHILIYKLSKEMWNTLLSVYGWKNERLDMFYCHLCNYT